MPFRSAVESHLLPGRLEAVPFLLRKALWDGLTSLDLCRPRGGAVCSPRISSYDRHRTAPPEVSGTLCLEVPKAMLPLFFLVRALLRGLGCLGYILFGGA